jgi:hypothetical protein
MARLFYGMGRGFKSSSGFKDPRVPLAYNSKIFRPKFSSSINQFIRKTSATNYTPWPFGDEGTGGGIISDSIVESVTATSTQDNTGIMVASEEESITVTDSQNRAYTTSSVITEALSAQDSLGSTAIYPSTVTEAGNSQEASDFTGAFVHSVEITEAVSAADSKDRSVNFSAGIIETVSADDLSDRISALSVSILETLSANDTLNGSYAIVKLLNGINLNHRIPPQGNDLRFKVGAVNIGVPLIAPTDDYTGAVRMKIGSTVYALQRAI